MTEEEWVTIWVYQLKCSSSQSWKEFGWKSLIRYFITPYQKSHYKANSPACWRNCGNTNANHYHVFWDCGVIKPIGREFIMQYKSFLGVTCLWKVQCYFLDSYLKDGQREANICLVSFWWQVKRPSPENGFNRRSQH